MATNEENDLIGYDPLAWMEGNTDQDEDQLNTDDLIENADEDPIVNLAEEDELVVDTIDEESARVLIEEMADDCSFDAMDTIAEDVIVSDPASEEMESSQIDLDATLSIQNVGKLHEKLKKSLALHDEIEINASDVSSIDTSTLQLLVALKKDAGKLQKKVTIIYPSPRFVESARLLGILDVLDVHEV